MQQYEMQQMEAGEDGQGYEYTQEQY